MASVERAATGGSSKTRRAPKGARVVELLNDSGSNALPVGSFQPSAWGVYDMHKNVWEWCEDWSHTNYNGAPTDGSAWLNGTKPEYREMRGGSWNDAAVNLRSASRPSEPPGVRRSDLGFRLAAVAQA